MTLEIFIQLLTAVSIVGGGGVAVGMVLAEVRGIRGDVAEIKRENHTRYDLVCNRLSAVEHELETLRRES